MTKAFSMAIYRAYALEQLKQAQQELIACISEGERLGIKDMEFRTLNNALESIQVLIQEEKQNKNRRLDRC